MAIIKINNLTALGSAPADGDQLVIVDVSEPADVNKTKKISVLTFFSGIVASIATKISTLIHRRQGGSATDWSIAGTTNYTPSPSNTKIQTGVATMSVVNQGTITVTFPVAFTYPPNIFLHFTYGFGGNAQYGAWAKSVTTTTFEIWIGTITGNMMSGNYTVNWLAIGE